MFNINNIISHLLAFVKKEFYKMSENNVRKEEPWDRVPKELRRKYGLAVSNVYAVLLDACPKGTTTVKVRQSWIAKECCISLRTVATTLKKLEELGLITKEKGIRASTYTITPVIRLKGEWKQDKQEEEHQEPKKRKYRKKPVHDVIREQETKEISKYLDLVN